MRTRAAVIYSIDDRFHVQEVELDEPQPNEVLVHLVASGVCHSDWHHITGDQIAQLPMIFGHEGAGVVEKVGSAVTHVEPGDHVVMSYLPSCGTCRWCTSGQTNLCDLGAYTVKGPLLDGRIASMTTTGAGWGSSAWSQHSASGLSFRRNRWSRCIRGTAWIAPVLSPAA